MHPKTRKQDRKNERCDRQNVRFDVDSIFDFTVEFGSHAPIVTGIDGARTANHALSLQKKAFDFGKIPYNVRFSSAYIRFFVTIILPASDCCGIIFWKKQ